MAFGIGGAWSWCRFFAGDAGVSPAINYEKTRPKGATMSTPKGCKSTAIVNGTMIPLARMERRCPQSGRGRGQKNVLCGGYIQRTPNGVLMHRLNSYRVTAYIIHFGLLIATNTLGVYAFFCLLMEFVPQER